jgi:recombination protein RecR
MIFGKVAQLVCICFVPHNSSNLIKTHPLGVIIGMLPDSIQQFSEVLRTLPGVGKRSSQKLALDLLALPVEEYQSLLIKLDEMRKKVQYCSVSGVLSETPISPMLSDTHRNQRLICVVQDPTDVLSVEKSAIYNGTYHVLFQLINPLENIFVDATTIPKLLQRISDAGSSVELVFFLKNSFAAEATVSYIKKSIDELSLPYDVKLTRLAQGLPLHFSTEYLDQATMVKAFEDRRPVV